MGFAQHYRAEGEQVGLKKGILIGEEKGREVGREEGREVGREEGREEGREVGREEGIPQGEAQILRRQLGRRFGALPTWVEARLSQATTDQLEHWADRILDADSLDAVFKDHP